MKEQECSLPNPNNHPPPTNRHQRRHQGISIHSGAFGLLLGKANSKKWKVEEQFEKIRYFVTPKSIAGFVGLFSKSC